MTQALEDHPHFQFMQSESYVSPREAEWERWVNRVEKALGHSLDGNQQRDGYSLDYANDAFQDNVSVEDFVAEVRELKAFIANGRS